MQRPPPNRSWWQRLRQRLPGRSADVIVATIGAGARDVVVGKNILRIGTLVVPALPVVIALVAALLSTMLGLWLYLVPATMPPGYVNIAIARFGRVDADGRIHTSADTDLIGRTLFATVRDEVRRLAPDYYGQVWHDSMGLLEKRTTIGMAVGATAQDRWQDACARATAVGAQIIVYGELDTRPSPALLRLSLCEHNPNRERDMGNFAELQRFDRLGGPLPVVLPLSDVQGSVNAPLRVRTTLVAKLIVGLRYELADAPSYIANLRKALGVFNDALAYLGAEEGAATADNGGDLVYYLIGREHFLLFQDAATPANERAGQLDMARAALERALALNPRYARALTTLGGVYFHLAQQRTPELRTQGPELGQALTTYQAAVAAAQASADQAAEAEARLALALAYRLQAEGLLAQATPDLPVAEAALGAADRAAQAADQLILPEQNRFRGVAAMVHGLIAHQRAQMLARTSGQAPAARAMFQQAVDAYRQCIAASQADPGDLFLKRQIVDVTCRPRAESAAAALARMTQ